MFSEYIRRLRESRGLNQSALATYIGATPTAVSRWEKDLHSPSPAYCKRIAAYFHVPEEEVLRMAGHLSGEVASEPRRLNPMQERVLAELEGESPVVQDAIWEMLPAVIRMARRVAEEGPGYGGERAS